MEVHPAPAGNFASDRFLAYWWEGTAGQHLLVAVNYGPTRGQGYVDLSNTGIRGNSLTVGDLMKPATYGVERPDVLSRGLYLELPAWGFQVFELTEVYPARA
jgi:hypothetical protein